MPSTRVLSTPLAVALYNADGSFRQPILLATIELRSFGDASPLTLHLSSPAYIGPDDQPWDGLIHEPSQISAGGAVLTEKWNPVDVDLVIQDRPVTGQVGGATFSDLFPLYEFVGARVLLQIAFDNTMVTSDYRTIFDGTITNFRNMDSLHVSLYCSQDREWSAVIPPRVMDKTYPNAPKDLKGVPIPIRFGNWQTGRRRMTLPGHLADYDPIFWAVARGHANTLPTSSQVADGPTQPQFLVSDRECAAGTGDLYIFESSVNQIAKTLTAPGESNPAGGPNILTLPSDRVYLVPILPVGIEPSTTGLNAQELLREDKPIDLAGFASLDWDAGAKVIMLTMPDVASLGTFVQMIVYIAYNKNSWSAPLGTFGIKNLSEITQSLADFVTPATTSPIGTARPEGDDSVTIATTGPVCSKWEDIPNCVVYIDVGAAGQKVDIHRIVPIVKYVPAGRIVRPGTTRQKATRYNVRGSPSNSRRAEFRFYYRTDITTPDVTEFETGQMALPVGMPDKHHASGALPGTYTGTDGAVIEHPCDLIHWLLRELGGLPATQITSDAGAFGSFVDARAVLAGYQFFGEWAQTTDVETAVAELAAEALCWAFRRTTVAGAPWVLIPWDTGAALNYRTATDLFRFNASDRTVQQGSLSVNRTDIARVVNRLHVNFDYDQRTSSYAQQIFIAPGDSWGWDGSAYVRDQNGSGPDNREAVATSSQALYGLRDAVVNLPHVKDPATAMSIRNRTFDWLVCPRVTVDFVTFHNAIDLERGHVIALGTDWDGLIAYPKPGSDGSWGSKRFIVTEVRRLAGLPVQYAVKATEIGSPGLPVEESETPPEPVSVTLRPARDFEWCDWTVVGSYSTPWESILYDDMPNCLSTDSDSMMAMAYMDALPAEAVTIVSVTVHALLAGDGSGTVDLLTWSAEGNAASSTVTPPAGDPQEFSTTFATDGDGATWTVARVNTAAFGVYSDVAPIGSYTFDQMWVVVEYTT